MSGRVSLLSNASLFEVAPAHIDVGDRIGFLHEDKAAALGRLMAVDGQRDPIKLIANPKNPDKPWKLVTGMHRTIGAEIEGITLWALEVSGKPEDLADLEASENLHRRPLAPIERAKFTAALVQAAQERIAREHGELSHQKLGAKLRWQRVKAGEARADEALTEESNDACAKFAQAYGWEESVGEALGMSRRSIHNDLQLFRLVIEPFSELAEPLSKHPVVGENASQLRLIAQVKEEDARRKVIEALLDDEEIGADDARIMAGVDRPAGPAPVAYQKHYNAIEGGWSRLGTGERKRFLREKFVRLLTPGEKRDLRDQLVAELDAAGETEAPTPAVPLRLSVKPDYIACLECGERFTDLEAHLRVEHDTNPDAYRERWVLPFDYPMIAPYAETPDAR